MNQIKRLPRSVHGPLRSSVLMFDLPRVVEELVNNSLDAGAAKVSVFVNVRTCYIKVEDNGCGITRDELVILGEKLGSEGDMMLSLSDISIVEIRTKARGKPNAYCKIIKGSRCLFLGIDDQGEDVGTTVVVRDLFYNQPVRRRYMQSSSQKVIHCVKKVIIRAALVHPQVSFKLIDIDREDELLSTVPASSPLPLVSSMFGEVSCSLCEVGFSDDILMLSGYISRPGEVFSTKALQYLYVNLRFVSKSRIHNLLNNLASTVMCSSALHSVNHLMQGRKRRKIQANPAFILNLHCPFSLYGIHFEPSKTVVEFKDWEKILAFFEEAARHSWQQHLAPAQQGNSFPQKNHRRRKCEAQDEETFIRDSTKGVGFTKKRSSCRIQQNSPQTQMTIPLGFSSEDTDVSQDHGESKKDLNRFFRNSESCQFGIDKIKESSPLQIFKKRAENLLDLTYHNITCTDIDSYKGFSNSLLENDVISDPVPQFIDEHDMLNSCSKYMSSEVGTSSEVAASAATSPKFQDAKIKYQEVEFSPPFCSLLSKSGTKSTSSYSLMKNMNYGTPYYSRHSELNCSIDWSRSHLFCDNIDTMTSGYNIKHLNYRSTSPCEIVDVSIPSFPTIRKCQTIRHPDVSSSGLISPYSCGHGCLSDAQGFDIGLREWAISPHYETLGSCAWHTRSTVDEFGPKNRSPLKSKLMRFEGYENWSSPKSECRDDCLSPHQDRSTVIFPRDRCMATKLDWNFSPSPMSKTHSFQLADEMDLENVCLSPTVTKLDWNHSQNPLRKTYSFGPPDDMVFDNICLSGKVNDDISCFSLGTLNCSYMEDKPKWDAVQKDTVKVGNLRDAQEFQSKDLPLNFMERSRRSQSAPPFYRGKCKFSVLGCPTTVVAMKPNSPFSKKSIGDLSRRHASQPFQQPFASEDCVPASIEPSGGKLKIYDVRYPCPDNAINDIQEDSASELVKWRHGVYQTKDGDSSQKSFQQADDILDISSGLLHFTGNSLVPELIDKNCLHDARVLLQLDNKFIPVMASGNLMVIDQHAADERIRLEELRRNVLSGKGREITYLDSGEELVLPEMGFQLLHKYAEKIKAWGWIFNSQSQLPELFDKNLNHFKRNQCGVSLVAVPCILGINLTDKDLLEYIEQLVETDGSSSFPPSVLRILNSKACRGAIMFGDSLLPSECSLIVEELKATSLCFQCAHGRPTTVPLLNISALHEQLEKLKLNKEGSNEAWHGLRHHPRTICRAQMLLDSSKQFHSG